MIRSLSGRPVCLSGTQGTGPVAEAIAKAIQRHDVAFRPHVLPGGDSPIELSIRDRSGNHKTLRLYGISRGRFRYAFRLPEEPVSGFVLSRYNQGRAEAIQRVFDWGGVTAMRIAEPTRYVGLDDYMKLLPATRVLVVSSRDGVVRKLARHLGFSDLPRAWPEGFDQIVHNLMRCLSAEAKVPRLVVLVFEREVSFFVLGTVPVTYLAPQKYDSRSRAARIQGACVAGALGTASYLPQNQDQLVTFAERAVQSAYFGTESRPTKYPAVTFEPRSSWLVAR